MMFFAMLAAISQPVALPRDEEATLAATNAVAAAAPAKAKPVAARRKRATRSSASR